LCNLYSVTKGQQAIRELAGAMRDRTGNLPPLPGIFPVGNRIGSERVSSNGQFKLGKLRVKDKTAPEIWNAVLAA
jgi:hypothetical protein